MQTRSSTVFLSRSLSSNVVNIRFSLVRGKSKQKKGDVIMHNGFYLELDSLKEDDQEASFWLFRKYRKRI